MNALFNRKYKSEVTASNDALGKSSSGLLLENEDHDNSNGNQMHHSRTRSEFEHVSLKTDERDLFANLASIQSNESRNSVTSENPDYEIVGYKNQKVYKKYKISNVWATVILVSIAVDTNYFILPYPFMLNPYLVSGFIVFYALSSLVSSFFLQRVADETKLTSLEEIAYLYGNRLTFFAVGAGLFIYYTFLSTEFIYIMNMIVIKYFHIQWSQPQVYIIWGIITLLLFPTIFVTDFKQLKKFSFLIILSNLILITLLTYEWLNDHYDEPITTEICHKIFHNENIQLTFLSGRSSWNFFHSYKVFFQFQTFQLIVYSYVGHRRQSYNGRVTSIATIILILLFTLAFSFLLNQAFIGQYNQECFSLCEQHTTEQWMQFFGQYYKIILMMFFLIAQFQGQFMFFIAREFLLVLYDEAKNRSVTKRVQIARNQRKSQQLFVNEMNIQEVDQGVFKTLRRTYQKLNKKEQLTIAAIAQGLIALLSLLYMLPSQRVKEHHGHFNEKPTATSYKALFQNQEQKCLDDDIWDDSVSGISTYSQTLFRAAEATLIYIMPAYFYRQMCIRYQYEPKTKHLALVIQYIGFCIMVFNLSCSFFAL